MDHIIKQSQDYQVVFEKSSPREAAIQDQRIGEKSLGIREPLLTTIGLYERISFPELK